MEAKIINLALDHFSELLSTVYETPGRREAATFVRTAFALSESQKEAIRSAMRAETGADVNIQFSKEEALLAGLELVVGSTVIRANLRDELAYFSEAKAL